MRLSISPRIALCLALGGISTGHAAYGQETTPPGAETAPPAAETPAAPTPSPAATPASPTTPAAPAGTDAKPPAQETAPGPAATTGSPMPAAAGAPAVPAATVSPTAPPHTALFRYYDKNGDQVLSAEELAKVPQPIREWFDKQKVDVAAGLTKEAFETSVPKLVEHLRSRTAETILAPVPLPAPGSVPAPAASSGGRSQRGPGVSGEFRALDLDGDAQLSFREWRAGKRLAGEFQPRDMNGDGVVTASEFDQTKALASTTAPASSPVRPSAPGSPAPPSTPGSTPAPQGGTSPAPAGTAPAPANSGLGNSASRQTFESLDKNKDGVLTPEELSGSRRVGPAFKEKGIDITKNMTREEFHANYAKAFPPR